MKRGRFSEEQIIGVLKEAEAGVKVAELCRRLKSIVVELALDIRALKDVLQKKRVRPAVRRQVVAEVIATHGLSERRACGPIGLS